ncbi:MAG TPA: F0F1 ATP synthase subunit gamma [Candidatus Limosilactobacillus intestinavium]|nr:F0F1 ATP synthase subunit gamma [Candidatus Limosilactobacillus intestinavium]
MPASLAAVKRRLDSTRSTRQITTAMQMVSTAKLNQVQSHTKTYQVYADEVKAILASLVKSHIATLKSKENAEKIGAEIGSLFDERPVKKVGILVITSDRGLVGSYNSNVIKSTLDTMKKNGLNKDNTVFLTVGKTGTEFFKKRGMNVVFEYTGVSDVPTYREVEGIVKKAVQMFEDHVYDQLYISYSHFVNRIVSHDRTELFLPISVKSLEEHEDERVAETVTNDIEAEYDLEPALLDMISLLVPQYANSLVYGAILDAKTSEHASSANAMKSASDNADDIIATLQLQYNRARQAAITTEITEITGGMTAQE